MCGVFVPVIQTTEICRAVHEGDLTQRAVHRIANERFGNEGLPDSPGLHILLHLVYTSALY